MNKYQEALEILKNRNSKIKINHKIGSRDIANYELQEIGKAIDNAIIVLQELVDKQTSKSGTNISGGIEINEEYKVNRIKEFTVGRKFKFKGIKYRVIDTNNENFMVYYKRLGFTFKKTFSGGRMKLTSIMDYNLKFLDGGC